jgi:two-component system phosphate regulon response regulator PhoB
MTISSGADESQRNQNPAHATNAARQGTMKPQILIVEDETSILTILRYNLEKADFTISEASNGEDGLQQIAERRPDLIILDWGLPLVSGFELCRQVRSSPDLRSIPIVMLTARGEEADKVRALDAGADDYVTKPFSVSELIARVRALLRRAKPNTSDKLLAFCGIVMDLAVHRVTRNGRPIHLGPTEYRLLRFFLERPRRVFSREQLLDAVWGYDIYVESRTVDVHIRRLRNAMNGAGEPDLIRTVRSAGYALEEAQPNRPPRGAVPRLAVG